MAAALETRFPVRLIRLNGHPEWNVPLAGTAAVPGRLPPFRDERGTCAQRVRKTDLLLERDPSKQVRSKQTNFRSFFFRSRILANGKRLPGTAKPSSTIPKVLIFN